MPPQSLVPTRDRALTPFAHSQYTIKRSFWSWLGRRFYVYGPEGQLLMFVKHPFLRLREEFTVYTDESETAALLHVKVRKLLTLDPAYDVFDAQTGERTGTLKKRGLRSILRDTWDILDANDQPAGLLEEQGAAILRRFLPFLTSKHRIELRGVEVGRIQQIFRFFIKEFVLDLAMAPNQIDPRFAIACALLALMAESRRESRS